MATTTRGKGEGAIFQRQHLSSCGPKGVNCKAKNPRVPHGLWVGRIELPPRANGDRRRKEITAKTKALLMEKMREPRNQFYEAGDLPDASQTTGEWLTYWLEKIVSPKVRPNTFNNYSAVTRHHLIPAIGRIGLSKLKPAHIRRVHDRMLATPKDPKHPELGNLSSSYALNAHRILTKALVDAEREGLIHKNPAKLIDAPRKAKVDLEPLDVAEAIEVIRRTIPALKADVYDPHPALYATLLLTGARRGEILGLERDRVTDHIDLSWQMQYIVNTSRLPSDYEYRHIADGLFWTRPKSSAGWRSIPLVEPLASLLQQHLLRAPESPFNLVFTTKDGAPLRPDTESKRWPAWLAESEITPKRVRLHDLRHTTVDLLYEAGVPEDAIMEIVGHSTRTVTRGYKARGNQKRLTDAMLALSELINPH